MLRSNNWLLDDDLFNPWSPSNPLESAFGLSFHPREFQTARCLPRLLLTPSGYSRNWALAKDKRSAVDKKGSGVNSVVSNEKDGFQLCLDVQQFAPNEISVKTVDNHIVVEGKHEERVDDLGLISRQFTRRYALPKGFNIADVESKLSSDGVLTVKVPPANKAIEEKEKTIPIQITGPAHGGESETAMEST